jgi:PAS domain-containing protein
LSYTGASAHAHLGSKWLRVIHPQDRQNLEAAWRSAVNSGVIFDADARLRRGDGAYRSFKMRSIPVSFGTGMKPLWFGTAGFFAAFGRSNHCCGR